MGERPPNAPGLKQGTSPRAGGGHPRPISQIPRDFCPSDTLSPGATSQDLPGQLGQKQGKQVCNGSLHLPLGATLTLTERWEPGCQGTVPAPNSAFQITPSRRLSYSATVLPTYEVGATVACILWRCPSRLRSDGALAPMVFRIFILTASCPVGTQLPVRPPALPMLTPLPHTHTGFLQAREIHWAKRAGSPTLQWRPETTQGTTDYTPRNPTRRV